LKFNKRASNVDTGGLSRETLAEHGETIDDDSIFMKDVFANFKTGIRVESDKPIGFGL